VILGIAVLIFIVAARAGRDRPVSIATTRAVRQDLSSWITSNGKVEPIEPHVIQAQLNTFVESLNVKEGQTVARGQTLLTLDVTDAQSELAHMREQLVSAEDERKVAAAGGPPEEVAQLQTDLAKAAIEISRLRRERESLERLYAKQAATRQELEQNKTALENAEATERLIQEKKNGLAQRSSLQAERASLRADQARHSIESLQEKVNSAKVVSPVSGTLYSLPARVATFVRTGDALAEVADLTRVRARAFVDEPEIGSLKEGQPVEVTWDASPNRTWGGQVQQLPATIVARGSRSVGEVLCSIDNSDVELLPNTNVNVRIQTGKHENSLVIPRGAIRTDGDMRYVFVVDHGRLRKQEVALGISNATIYEVVEGITEDDLVALPGNSDLQNGLAVNVADQKGNSGFQ
jgi:HlyD family secretion protein